MSVQEELDLDKNQLLYWRILSSDVDRTTVIWFKLVINVYINSFLCLFGFIGKWHSLNYLCPMALILVF